jgi:hypothetical protein
VHHTKIALGSENPVPPHVTVWGVTINGSKYKSYQLRTRQSTPREEQASGTSKGIR